MNQLTYKTIVVKTTIVSKLWVIALARGHGTSIGTQREFSLFTWWVLRVNRPRCDAVVGFSECHGEMVWNPCEMALWFRFLKGCNTHYTRTCLCICCQKQKRSHVRCFQSLSTHTVNYRLFFIRIFQKILEKEYMTFPRYNLNYTKCSFIFKNRTMQLIWQTLFKPTHFFTHPLVSGKTIRSFSPKCIFFSLWGFKHYSDMNKPLWKISTFRWTQVRGKILWRRGRFPLKGSWHWCVHHRRKSADLYLSSILCKPPKIA